MASSEFRRVLTGALWLTFGLWISTTQCHADGCVNGTSIGFTAITTRRNATQCDTEVKFDHHGDVITNGQWSMSLHQSSMDCPGIIHFTASLSAPPARVVPGYDFLPAVGYYKMHPPGKNWEDARRTCVREGGHLAIINSEVESTVLQLMFARTSSQQPYALIGFHDHYTEGEYLTLYDQPIATTGFSRWGNGQPDNVGAGENCGSVYRVDGSLNDISCDSTGWPFICEQDL